MSVASSRHARPGAPAKPPIVRRSHVHISALLLLLAVGAVGGYAGDWRWTGFHGNTLWDWLHLLVLPVALALLPLWLRTRERLEPRWLVLLVGLAFAFAVVAVGGYAFDWTWTGFRGNTLWDWIQLLLVPFVLPAVLTHLSVRSKR